MIKILWSNIGKWWLIHSFLLPVTPLVIFSILSLLVIVQVWSLSPLHLIFGPYSSFLHISFSCFWVFSSTPCIIEVTLRVILVGAHLNERYLSVGFFGFRVLLFHNIVDCKRLDWLPFRPQLESGFPRREHVCPPVF